MHAPVVSSLDLLPTFVSAANAKPLPLTEPKSHEDKSNRKRAIKKYGEYDGVNLLPILSGKQPPKPRTLFWRLHGKRAVLSGTDKLIAPSHRPAQLFAPATDPGETNDRRTTHAAQFMKLFKQLSEWEASPATVPLWGRQLTGLVKVQGTTTTGQCARNRCRRGQALKTGLMPEANQRIWS